MRGREYAVEYWSMEPTGDLRACEKHAHTHVGVVNMTSFLWWAGTQSPRGENRALICNVCYLCGVITLTMADFRLLVIQQLAVTVPWSHCLIRSTKQLCKIGTIIPFDRRGLEKVDSGSREEMVAKLGVS